MRTYRTVAVLAVASAIAGTSSTAAFAAPESNNRAELTGVGKGVAIVNYAKGAPAEWRSSVNVRGLPDGSFTFRVAGGPMPAPQTLCTFTVGDGRSGSRATPTSAASPPRRSWTPQALWWGAVCSRAAADSASASR